jgi:phenylacetate-coenzyme A ligase PaaK-like adenylate-forming protein
MDLLTRIRREQLENGLGGAPRTSEEVLASADYDVGDGMVFETSGRSGEAKRIPCAKPDHVLGLIEDALVLAGFEGDVAINLGAPLPHPTGWGFREAMERVGGRAVNDHFKDFQTVLEDGSPAEVTAIFGVPNVVRAVGEELAEAHGPPAELFPNVERIGTAGDLLTSNRREAIRELWGAAETREMYGTSEFMAVAGADDGTRQLVPFLHRFVLEIVPEDDPDSIVDIRDVDERRRGSLLITDPARTAVDLTRYQINDRVAVHPTGDVPRITFLGREDDSINLSGALLYPAQIHESIHETYGPDADWVAVVSDHGYPAVDFYVVGSDGDPDRFVETLLERNGPVREAYRDVGVVDSLEVHQVDSRADVPGVSPEGGIKGQNVVFDDSYGRPDEE